MLQIFVWLTKSEQAGNRGALISIAISAITTGYTSAIVGFDFDCDAAHRKNDPAFYGYIPNQHSLRQQCFALMAAISSIHNLSRSVGCALLAASASSSSVSTLVYFVGGEVVIYLAYKVVRRDFMYWPRVEGAFGFILSFVVRIIIKIIVDFSGCVHFRHPFELGGVAFFTSMLWAQIMPFVALHMFMEDESNTGNVTKVSRLD